MYNIKIEISHQAGEYRGRKFQPVALLFGSLNFIIHNADEASANDAHEVAILICVVDFLVQNPVLADEAQQDQQEIPHGRAVDEI